MPEKQRPTAADHIVTAISPALITGLIGSLVFFLVEVLYAGRYEARLLWTLFFLTGGMVLVARIAISVDSARAKAYGLALAGVSWAALVAFVRFPEDSPMANFSGLINLFLMGIIWWCASKLTWDCTYIDETRKASGKGLLAATGMEETPATAGQARDEELRNETQEAPAGQRRSFLERWQRYQARRRKRAHTPGQTIVWFSLASLPIFGLGQSLIPPDDTGRRAFTFWLAAIYVGCALGLLLTTSFLGLRRYLRQRKLPMPTAITARWLGLGAGFVLAFLLIGALLPRPYSETPIWNLDRLRSSDRQATKNSVFRDSTGKGEGTPGRQAKAGDGSGTSKNGRPGGSGKDGDAKQGSGDKKDGEQGGGNQKSEKGKGSDGEDRQKRSATDDSSRGEKEAEREDGSSSGDSDRRFPDTKLGGVLEKIGSVLKWIVFIVLAIVVAAFLFRSVLQYFANFSPWARNLLAALSAWWRGIFASRTKPPAPTIAEPVKPAQRPFSSFANPFAADGAEWRVEELVAYSFAALEAWAAERNHPRRPDETPLEFASRLASTFRSLQGHPHKLAILVVRMVYSGGKLPDDARETLESLWDRLATTVAVAEAS